MKVKVIGNCRRRNNRSWEIGRCNIDMSSEMTFLYIEGIGSCCAIILLLNSTRPLETSSIVGAIDLPREFPITLLELGIKRVKIIVF